tara:strand:- start:1063 stop:1440 length:378 start_codon:yes stop_codon:yes gene_type:complete
MTQDAIKIIGKKEKSREEASLFMVNEVEGLVETFDKDFSEWSDFDCWGNMVLQKWIFSRAMDVYHGEKIDIKCDCCEIIDLNQFEKKNESVQKCYGFKSLYMIKKVLDEIVLAKKRRESDGTYSA